MFKLPHIPSSKDLIDQSFRQARKQADLVLGKRIKDREVKIKIAEAKRIGVFGKNVCGVLDAVVSGFPSFDQMPIFYQSLFETVIDLDRYRKSLARVQGASKQVARFRDKYIREIKYGDADDAKRYSKEFFGRAASLVKPLAKDLDWLNVVKSSFRDFPTVKEDPTIVIAGYPNVGKSTLLKTLTKSKVETAAYPFTTKRVMFGYRKHRYVEYQIVDTPGLLDRPFGEMNPIERQAVTALRHLAHIIVFIFDECQEVEPQVSLLRQVEEVLGVGVLKCLNVRENIKPSYSIPAKMRKDCIVFDALKESDCGMVFKVCVEKIREKL
ncbi:MAG TPA: GTP-binding protein [Candidatus Altiarchaeales archaeon]|nr:GTP-binding protein [Candidatus Altiarchaeales archaeon]